MPVKPVKPLDIDYNAFTDIVTIDGVSYTGEVFRTFALPESDCLYSFERTEGGGVIIQRHGTKKELGLC
jgi:microcystin-dependent protein